MPRHPYPIDDIIRLIADAWYGGRKIVPIIGAGISVDSGFPIITQLNEYLAKLHVLLERVAYLPQDLRNGGERTKLGDFAALCRQFPSHYVSRFGWPDRSDLNHELELEFKDSNALEQSVLGAYNKILKRVKPVEFVEFEKLRKAVEKIAANTDLLKEIQARFQRNESDNYTPFEILNDWRQVLQHFTHHHQDYADALFHHFGAARKPNAGHRYLAFLVKLLSCRTIFTFNFDDLIEQALTMEGVEHVAFAMEHGSSLPYPRLVEDTTAVVKMHGGTHGLLLDERLSRPVTDQYADRFMALVGREPLILVMGVSGEARLLNLLERVVEAEPKADIAWFYFGGRVPDALYEAASSEADKKLKPRYSPAQTKNIGYSLQQIYGSLTFRNPVSPQHYMVGVSTPIRQERRLPDPQPDAKEETPSPVQKRLQAIVDQLDKPNHLLFIKTECKKGEYLTRTSSEDLVDLTEKWGRRGPVIWVNLEAYHTLAAVVGSIISQCHRYDPALPPVVLPIRDDPENGAVITAAVDRVVTALSRNRYLVLIDGLETYEWLPFSHHGDLGGEAGNLSKRIDTLTQFLKQLQVRREELRSSRIVLAMHVDPNSRSRSQEHRAGAELPESEETRGKGKRKKPPRYSINWECLDPATKNTAVAQPFLGVKDQPGLYSNETAPFFRLKEEVARSLQTAYESYLPPEHRLASPPGQDVTAKWSIVLTLLTATRRARSLIMVRQLLRTMFDTGPEFDAAMAALTDPAVCERLTLTRLEGGGLWVTRGVRNKIYDLNSQLARSPVFSGLLRVADEKVDVQRYAACVAQLYGLVCLHQRISHIFLAHMFLPSQDATVFLEYVYHRITALRYLNKLMALCRAGSNVWYAFRLGIGRVGKYVFEAVGESGSTYVSHEMNITQAFKEGLESDDGYNQVRQELNELRIKELQSLIGAWRQNELVLRTQLPPPQLEFCSGVLVAEDIENRLRQINLGKNDVHKFDAEADADWLAAVEVFESVLRDFNVKVLYENGDYFRAAKRRLKHLLGKAYPKGKNPLQKSVADVVKRLDEGRFLPTNDEVHSLIDVIVCPTHFSRQDPGSPASKVNELSQHIRLICERELSTTPGTNTRKPEWYEARLRLHHFEPELELGPSVFHGKDGYRGSGQDAIEGDLDGCLQTLVEGLELVRVAPPRPDGRLRSLIFDVSPGASLYLPYRAALHAMRGRLTWLAAVKRFGNSHDPATTAQMTAKINTQFERAFQDFDISRAGLQGTNRQFALTNELYRAEACLVRARLALNPYDALKNEDRNWQVAKAGSEGKDTRDRCHELIGLARAKYETARSALKVARGHLLTGRRNVIGWRMFYALAAQYHADRLALSFLDLHEILPVADRDFIRTQAAKPVSRDAELYTRIKRGYTALRLAFDVAPTDPQASITGHHQWLLRAWAELTYFGYACAVNLPDGALERLQADSILNFLNQRTRVIEHPHIEKLWDDRPVWEEARYNALWTRPINTGQTAPEPGEPSAEHPTYDIMVRRREILNLAREKSVGASVAGKQESGAPEET